LPEYFLIRAANCGSFCPFAHVGASTIVNSTDAFSCVASATSLSTFVQTYAGSAGFAGSSGSAGSGLQSGTLTHCFPAADTIAAADPDTLPMPRSRARALVGLAAALASGAVRLDPGASREEASGQLLALPGIGPWTVGYIRMRALSDPDAFLPTDAGVRHGLAALGAASDPTAAESAAEAWRPWRSYALQHLWAYLEKEKS